MVVTQGKVVEAVAALNIQLDNLCQFLPQDRVVAFAQMSPCELLLETEKAFGARELFEQHTQLMESKAGMKELETEVAQLAADLERDKGLNAGLERDVERFNARAALLEKVKAMKAKLPWVHYDAARVAHDAAREDAAAAKKIVSPALLLASFLTKLALTRMLTRRLLRRRRSWTSFLRRSKQRTLQRMT